MKAVKHKENVVVFDKEKHIYLLNGKEQLTSGTTFIKSFFTKFEADKIAGFVAKKEGVSKQEILAMWEEKGKNAANYGTKVHNYAESLIKGTTIEKQTDNIFRYVDVAVNEISKQLEILDTEKIIFSGINHVAGTIDLLARKEDTVYVLDWKTNEKIEKENKYNKFGKEPINNLPDNNFTHYSLQLNLYQYILYTEGYFPPDIKYRRALLHITNNSFQWIEIPDMQLEISNMLIPF